jgi:hypothetical protein
MRVILRKYSKRSIPGAITINTLHRPNAAKAAGNVYIQQVPVGVYNPIRGSNVVGFSCAGSGAGTACHIASQ